MVHATRSGNAPESAHRFSGGVAVGIHETAGSVAVDPPAILFALE